MNHYFSIKKDIINIGIDNQMTISSLINRGFYKAAQDLNKSDDVLFFLYKNFTTTIADKVKAGYTLMVGDGNLSFSSSLIKDHKLNPINIVATIFDKELEEDSLSNKHFLEKNGVNVITEVDGTKLEKYFKNQKFDNIIFQFPNAGSREPINGYNPTYILIKNFLLSTKNVLNNNGKVFITIVDSKFYEDQLKLNEIRKEVSFNLVLKQPFFFEDFPYYQHRNTNDSDSATEDYDKFITYIFSNN
jgi:hypothetical protein